MTREAETLGGSEQRMTRNQEQTGKVERHLPGMWTPAQSQRRTEAQLVKVLKNQTRKSHRPPLNPVRRLNQAANRAPVHRLNPATYLRERTKKIS